MKMHSEISTVRVLKITSSCMEQKPPQMGVVRLLFGKMAVHVNRDPKVPKVEVIRRNFFFIQQSIAASRPVLLTVTGYLLQFELITRQNHEDALARGRLGLVHQAATLTRTVESKIKRNPDLYFPRFTQALRLSNLHHVADRLEQHADSLRTTPLHMQEYEAVPAWSGNGLAIQREELAAMLLGTGSESDGSMLQQLLTNIERVLTLADGVSTDTACAVMECLKRAYTYVHTVSQDRFKLEDCSVKTLDRFDAAFKRSLGYRLEEKEHQASEELDSCEQLLEEAVREARRDRDKIKERAQEESQMSLRELEDIRCDAEEMISDARESLTEDKDNLISIAEGIDELLVNLKEASDRSDRQYWEMQDELRAEGFSNLCRQERLAEKRFWLKKREMEVTSNVDESSMKDKEQELSSNEEQVTDQLDEQVKNLKIVMATALGEEYYHSQADQLYDELVEGFSEKREDLNTQCEQAKTSLLILDILNECVQLVMEDAKKWKSEWEQQLPEMKLTNLLQLRDALMATACIHMMRLETSSEKDTEGQEQTQLKGKVKQLQDELEVTDQQITALNPLLHLDTLRQRFKMLQSDIGLVLEKKDISAVELTSRGTYVELEKSRPRRVSFKETDKQGCERGRVTRNRKRQRERSVPTRRGLRQRKPCPSIGRQDIQCQKTYSTRSSLNQQKAVHTADKQQRGIDNGHKQTGRKTRSGAQKQASRSLRRQMNKKLAAANTLRQCSICQKKLSGRSSLRRHLLAHTGEKPFKCKTCQRDFMERGNLRKHMLTHTGEKPHQCNVCLKSFSRLSNLRRHHSLVHSGKKTHECRYCHKKFSNRTHLREHLVTHTGEKPFKCKTCQRDFSHRSNLSKHILTHTGEKPYQCTVCLKSFSQTSNLRSHSLVHPELHNSLIHSGRKIQECHYCHKKFGQQRDLKRHLLIHTGEKPFQCTHCSRSFNLHSNMRWHINALHKDKQ